jgi:hypothetical protein
LEDLKRGGVFSKRFASSNHLLCQRAEAASTLHGSCAGGHDINRPVIVPRIFRLPQPFFAETV